MASNRVFDIDSVLGAVDSLVTRIDAEAEMTLRAEDPGSQVPGVLHKKGLAALESLMERTRDGAAEVRVSSDGMTAEADFYPPSGDGSPLVLDTFLYQLEKAGVVHGILGAVIRQVLDESTLDQRVIEGVAVARGTPPVDFLPQRWEILPELLERKQVLDQKAAFLDFKTQSPFVLVKEGDLLARLIPEQRGAQGRDVRGKVLEPGRGRAVDLHAGKNTVEASEGIRAACDGCFRSVADKLWVDEILVLDSGVGYETGHIDFAGEVHIVGDVAAGFHIWAGGSVVSTRVIDATEVISGGDVVTPFGIIGRTGAVVKAEGRVRAKFLENVYLVAHGAVEIQTSILNCVVQSLDRVVLGDKGLVMGGKITALEGVDAFQFGSDRGAKAELVCGMDYTVLERIAWSRDQSLSLVKQLKTLESYKDHHPSQAKALGEACAKVRNQILKLSELSRTLACQIDRNDDAAVTVRGLAYPGTFIEICHVSYVVPKPMGRVRFVLDKHRGQIRAVPL